MAPIETVASICDFLSFGCGNKSPLSPGLMVGEDQLLESNGPRWMGGPADMEGRNVVWSVKWTHKAV